MWPSREAAKQNRPLTRNCPMLAPNRERDTNRDRAMERFSPEIGTIDVEPNIFVSPPNFSAKLVTTSDEVFISSMLRTQRNEKLMRR